MGLSLKLATWPSLSSAESTIFTEAMRSNTPVTATWVTVLPSRRVTSYLSPTLTPSVRPRSM